MTTRTASRTPAGITAPATGFTTGEFGQLLAPDTLRFERRLPGSIERAWSYLVEPEKRAKWLAAGAIEPRVGGRVNLHFRNLDLSPVKDPAPAKFAAIENGADLAGRVLRYDPPHTLSFTWGGDPTPDPTSPAACGKGSEVTFELTQQADHTLLVVTHRRLGIPAERLGVAGGWHTHLAILLDHLEGRQPRPFWSTHTALDAEYQHRLPKD